MKRMNKKKYSQLVTSKIILNLLGNMETIKIMDNL